MLRGNNYIITNLAAYSNLSNLKDTDCLNQQKMFKSTKEARECAIFYITLSSILVYWSDILCCTLVVKYPLTTATEIILSKIIRKLFGMHGQFYIAWFRIHKHQPDHCLDIFANKKFI